MADWSPEGPGPDPGPRRKYARECPWAGCGPAWDECLGGCVEGFLPEPAQVWVSCVLQLVVFLNFSCGGQIRQDSRRDSPHQTTMNTRKTGSARFSWRCVRLESKSSFPSKVLRRILRVRSEGRVWHVVHNEMGYFFYLDPGKRAPETTSETDL